MKKYRIIQEIWDKEVYFMPQKKTLFGWKYFDSYTLEGFPYRRRFDTYNEALEYIKNDEDAKVAFAKGDRILII
jgi:hypothetical protein